MDLRSTITAPHGAVHQGTIYRKNKSAYIVSSAGRLLTCTLSTRLWKELSQGRQNRNDPLAVGDAVRYTENSGEDGSIVELLPRRSTFSRARGGEQLLAANIDRLVPVFAAAEPAPRWNMLDRCLVTAESRGLPALICVTKLDLLERAGAQARREVEETLADYRRIGYPVFEVSAATGQGMDVLREALAGGLSLLLGKSGAGKSTLVNALRPGQNLRTGAVSQATGKGRHTTTAAEIFDLPGGGLLVDTPGLREFGLWDVDPDEIAGLFPEMRPFVGRCRFGLDCAHDEEPGCAVRQAAMRGDISLRRYHSYLRMKTGD